MNGRPGLRAVEERLPALREELDVDFCVVNGENVADGVGITPKLADKLLAAGADVLTLGNHIWRRREIMPYLSGSDRRDPAREPLRPVARPRRDRRAGQRRDAGRGDQPARRSLHAAGRRPVRDVDALVEEARRETPIVLVDFHGEATSEKVALAHYLDGRVTAVFGTHTHVQTNDARVQPGGTAAITDAGMTGPHDSVIGVKSELAIRRMRTGMPVRFETGRGRRPPRGRARRMRRLRPRDELRGRSRRGPVGGSASTSRSATSTRSRASTSHDWSAPKWSASSQ